jgi:hypothetical protein
MEDNKNGAYIATLTITSDANDEGPYMVDMKFNPPYAEVVDKLGHAPASYQFMGKVFDEVVLPVLAFNDRYEAEMLADEEIGADYIGPCEGDSIN